MIKISNLKKSFKQNQNEIMILNNLSLEIPKGKTVGILGHSGSGKSTLLSLLAGLDKPDNGEIFIDSTDLTRLNEDQLTDFRAKNISIVFQQYHLISHLTAIENVMLPLEILKSPINDYRSSAAKLLEEVGLENRVDHFPAQLSGGESQRVAIARALVSKPSLLLADEPSGNLDQETGTKVMSLFFDITRRYSITSLLVTHNENLIQNCDFAYRLKKGQFETVK